MKTGKSLKFWQWETIVVSMVVYAIYYFVRKNFSIAMPGLTAEYGISNTSFGIVMFIASLTYGFSRFINGFIVEKVSTRAFMAIGLVLGVLSFVFMPQIVDWLGSDQQMAYYSILYGRMLAAALPFSILQMTFTPFFMTAERPDLGTKFTIICGLVNIVLDAIFIGWLQWGIAGAAAATIASQMVGSIGPLLYFSTKRNHSSFGIAA